jgi:hypothetical protein
MHSTALNEQVEMKFVAANRNSDLEWWKFRPVWVFVKTWVHFNTYFDNYLLKQQTAKSLVS